METKSPSAEVQPWAMEAKVLRREYSRGQWRQKSFGGSTAVGNGDQKSFGGSTAVGNGDQSPAAGVQPWAIEIKVLRREYSRGQ